MDILVRQATVDDAKELLDIFKPYVEQTAITFDIIPPTLAEFQERIRKISKDYPYLVAVKDGKIVGYAYAHQFKEQAAYHLSVETSIYLDMNERHQGIGRILYAELEKQLKAKGILNMNACITYMDKADEYLPLDSISFHTTMGFTRCAHFHQIGFKFRRWYDMIWMEKLIGKH